MDVKSYARRVWYWVSKGLPSVHVDVVTCPPANIFANRCVLITGGARGLGFAIAKRLYAEGATVVLFGRNAESLERSCENLGKRAFWIQGDIGDLSSTTSLFERAEKISGYVIDTLVSNAGISLHEGNFRNVTEEGWDSQMDTNLKGGFFLCQQFVAYLEDRNAQTGNILVVTSERSRRPDDIPYGLTKVASDSYVRAMASRLIRKGIRVNGLAPGVTCSDMTGRDPEGNLCNHWQNNGRIFLPDEVAEVACFILSDAAACISGEIIACNQGNHIQLW